jgi:hypothetical protein
MTTSRVFANELTLVVVVLLHLGCGNPEPPNRPTPLADTPTLEYRLSGRVVDTAYRPLAGSTVEVVNGSRAGTVATTDEAGRFSMPGLFTGTTTVRASKDGYVPETRTIPFPSDRLPPTIEAVEMQLYLQPLAPNANIAGVYTLTLTADSACTSLPAEARTRTYTATIAPLSRAGFFLATLSDARFFSTVPCPPGRPLETCTYNRFSIGIAGDYASIHVGFVEEFGEKTYLALVAGAEGSFGPNGITTPLSGYSLYCPIEPFLIDQGTWACPASAGDRAVYCDSDKHQLSLVRR